MTHSQYQIAGGSQEERENASEKEMIFCFVLGKHHIRFGSVIISVDLGTILVSHES